MLIALPPCGRGLGACAAIVDAGHLRCLTCGCTAPITARTSLKFSTSGMAPALAAPDAQADGAKKEMTMSHDDGKMTIKTAELTCPCCGHPVELHDDAVRMISEVAEASGLLDAVRNELAFAEGWPEERDVAQIRATMERSFRCTARTLPGMGLTCPACGTSMPGIRCPKCNRKLAVLEVELQHMAKETIE